MVSINLYDYKIKTFSDENCTVPCTSFNIDSVCYVQVVKVDFNKTETLLMSVKPSVDRGEVSDKSSSTLPGWSYTCSKFGLVTFSYKGRIAQIRVKGWKRYGEPRTASNGWEVIVEYNETTARCTVKDPAQVSFDTSWANYVSGLLTDSWIRPYSTMFFAMSFNRWFIVTDYDTVRKTSNSSKSGTCYVQMSWAHRGVPK